MLTVPEAISSGVGMNASRSAGNGLSIGLVSAMLDPRNPHYEGSRERHGHGEAEAIVTPDERDALHCSGRLLRDRGDSRLLASMDNWSFMDHLKRPRP